MLMGSGASRYPTSSGVRAARSSRGQPAHAEVTIWSRLHWASQPSAARIEPPAATTRGGSPARQGATSGSAQESPAVR